MVCTVHKLVADVAVLSEGRVLLVKYRDTAKYDRQVGWFLPDDFLAHGEDPDEGAQRILREQVGLADAGPRLSHVESFVGGPQDAWHLVFHFAATLPEADPLSPGENVRDASWFGLDKLPKPTEVAHGGWALEVLEEIEARRL